jgi:hypothetical protein
MPPASNRQADPEDCRVRVLRKNSPLSPSFGLKSCHTVTEGNMIEAAIISRRDDLRRSGIAGIKNFINLN